MRKSSWLANSKARKQKAINTYEFGEFIIFLVCFPYKKIKVKRTGIKLTHLGFFRCGLHPVECPWAPRAPPPGGWTSRRWPERSPWRGSHHGWRRGWGRSGRRCASQQPGTEWGTRWSLAAQAERAGQSLSRYLAPWARYARAPPPLGSRAEPPASLAAMLQTQHEVLGDLS